MSDFENYPYNEQHELNLDPTLKDLKEDKTTAENANKRVDGVEDTINNDNKKLDDANAKADAINQNADNFVDQSNTRINDIEDNADNSVNDINKNANDISDKADDLNEKINDNADKVDDIDNKQNETKEQVDDSVSNAYYENELTAEEMKSAKKMGVLKVTKANGTTSNEISTITPSGALGNCVVWSSSPFTFINNNPQILTDQDFSGNKIIQYQCAGSFFLFPSSDKQTPGVFGSNGHLYGNSLATDGNILVTPNHLNINLYGSRPSSDLHTVILPKTDSGTWDGNYEQFTDVSEGQVVSTKENLMPNHIYVYCFSSGDDQRIMGYIYNGILTQTKDNSSTYNKLSATYSNSVLTLKAERYNSTTHAILTLYFVDLGEM